MVATISNISDFEISVLNGDIINTNLISISGRNLNVSTSLATLWEQGGLVEHPILAENMTISSTSVNDVNLSGTGAGIARISGLDENFVEVIQDINLNGQNAVVIPIKMIRVNDIEIISGSINDGDIYVGIGSVVSGIPLTIRSKMLAGLGQTHQGFFTVPKNKKVFLRKFIIGSGKAANNAIISLWVKVFGRPLVNIANLGFKEDRTFLHVTLRFPEKTDIEFRGIADTGSVTADLIVQYVIMDS